jgi:hypothetical protein
MQAKIIIVVIAVVEGASFSLKGVKGKNSFIGAPYECMQTLTGVHVCSSMKKGSPDRLP